MREHFAEKDAGCGHPNHGNPDHDCNPFVARNPLCLDAEHRCTTCGSRLNTATTERFRECPLGCGEVAS